MALNVKTRDWGKNFAGLSQHIAEKSAASVNHSKELNKEIAAHGGHAYGRHGHQADWITQVVRAVTGQQPDQPFSPNGVEGVIREWNARWVGSDKGAFSRIVNTYDAKGKSVTAPSGSGFVPKATSYEDVRGVESGGFLSPGLQQHARKKATDLANMNFNLVWALFPGTKATKNLPDAPWARVERCQVVVNAAPFAGFGLGFKRKGTFKTRTREEVLALVDAFERGKTRKQVGLKDQGAATTTVAKPGEKPLPLRAEENRPAFPSMGDLLDYLGLESFWQKNALVIFQRGTVGWELVTMYPCNMFGIGWAPTNHFVPKGKRWSGKAAMANYAEKNFAVPVWVK